MTKTSLKVSIFPKSPNAGFGAGCSGCSGCSSVGSTGPSLEAEQEALEDLTFRLEEIGYEKGEPINVSVIDVSDVNYTLELLNVALVTSGSSERITHDNYNMFMTHNAPIITVNNKIIFKGKIPRKDELVESLSQFN